MKIKRVVNQIPGTNIQEKRTLFLKNHFIRTSRLKIAKTKGKISASELMEKGNIKEHRIELYHVFSKNFLRTKFIGDGEILRPPSIGRNLLVLIKKSAESRYFKYVRVHF